MRLWDEDPNMPPPSPAVVRAMDKELVRLRRMVAVRDAQLRTLSEAYANLEIMMVERGIRPPNNMT